MKNEHELDKLFRKKLNKSKVEHPGHLWNGIQQSLDEIYKEARKKRRIFFFSVGLVLLGGAVGAGILLNPQDKKLDENVRQLANDKQIAHNESVINSSGVNDIPVSTNRNGNISKEATRGIERQINDVSNMRGEKTMTNRNDKVKKNLAYAVQESSVEATESRLGTNVIVRGALFEPTIYNESGGLMNKDQLAFIQHEQFDVQALGKSIFRPAVSLYSEKVENIFVKEGCLDYVDKPFSKMFIEIFGGTQMADRLLYTEDSDWQANVNKRNESETVNNTFSFGIRFNYMFDRGISLKTGFVYTAINEEFKYRSGEIQIIHRDPDGNIIKTTYEPIYSTQNNVYTFYDIPLLLSYNWSKKGLFAEFNSGFLINFYAKQSGEFFNIEGDRVGFQNTNNTFGRPFKKFVGASLYTSASVGYEFSNNASLFIEPHIRYFLRSISANAYPIEQKYINYGFYLGARYRIK